MASLTVTDLISDLNHAVSINATIACIDDRDSLNIEEDANVYGGGLACYALFGNKSSVKVSVEDQHTSYDAKLNEYLSDPTSSDENRKDNIWAGALDFEFPILNNVVLFASYSYIYSRSDVDIYDYNRNIIESGLTIHY